MTPSTAHTSLPVRIAATRAETLDRAVGELVDGLGAGPFPVVLLFSSPRYPPEDLVPRLARAIDAPIAGCTSAGEIGPGGLVTGGAVAVALPAGGVTAQVFAAENARHLDLGLFDGWREQLGGAAPSGAAAGRGGDLGLVLADGLCRREEHLVAALHDRFRPMRLVGASAGDDSRYEQTVVFAGDRVLPGGLVFVALELGGIPFRTFRLQDIRPLTEPLVITGARVEERQVVEIEGRPAAEVFAELAGGPPEGPDDARIRSFSLMVTIGGEEYIRSVRRVLDDGSLELHSAIDEGVVVRIGRSDDTTVGLRRLVESLERNAERPDLVLCFDCLHRRWELERQGRLDQASELLRALPVVGFTTYGEIVDSLHVNQTLTGVLIGGSVRGEPA